MKKCIVFLLALAVIIGLSACKTPTRQNAKEARKESTEVTAAESAAATLASAAPTEVPAAETSVTSTDAPAGATVETASQAPTEETTAPTETPTEAPTEEPHSEFYVAGVSADEMVTYFNEMVLDVENTAGEAGASLVQKWDQPIAYRIDGAPTRRDGQTINQLAKQLNEVEGFPGIYAATGLEQNVTISFLREAEYKTQFSHLFDGELEDSVMQFWHYSENNSIYYGRIGYCKDTSQDIRDLVIPKELLNLLGVRNAALQKDGADDQEESNKKDSEITVLSDLDLAIVKLLYNPRIQCGMNAAECEEIIRELYY